MELNIIDISKFTNAVMVGVPNQIAMLSEKERYGSVEFNIAYGYYEKHSSFKKFIKNIKQIIWLKN